MLDVVPDTVQLSDVITPMTYKAVNIQYDLSSDGTVTIAGLIRNLVASTDSFPSSIDYTTTCGSTDTTFTTDAQSETGTSQYGQTAYFPFNTTLDSLQCSALSVSNTSLAPLNPSIFVLPIQSTSSRSGITLQAAALTSLAEEGDMTAVFYIATQQQGTAANAVVNTTITMSETGTAGNYTIYEGSVTANSPGDIVVKVSQGDLSSVNVKSTIFG